MMSFASNMLLTRFAVTRMPLESGFLLVLGTNIVFPAAMYAAELAVRLQPYSWSWKGAGFFALSGIIGTFLGRRALFDTVSLLGASRASIFHSSSPAFALFGAWLLAGEGLGRYEIALVAVVWIGLWLTQPPPGTSAGLVRVSPEVLRKGIIAGLAATAGFAFGNVMRGLAMHSWAEAALGTMISALAAFVLQVAVTRDWGMITAQFRAAPRSGMALYVACGLATSFGSMFSALAMTKLEIGLTVLVVHSTPLVVFPVSVLVLKQREAISGRTLTGAVLVLAGIAALALRR